MVEINTSKITDLVGKVLEIKIYKEMYIDTDVKLVIGIDVETGDMFVLDEIKQSVTKGI